MWQSADIRRSACDVLDWRAARSLEVLARRAVAGDLAACGATERISHTAPLSGGSEYPIFGTIHRPRHGGDERPAASRAEQIRPELCEPIAVQRHDISGRDRHDLRQQPR